MTPKIKVDLSGSGCQKKGCPRRFEKAAHRHHIRHKKFWVNQWRNHRDLFLDPNEPWSHFVRVLEARYRRFLIRDTVRLCENHHVEIHEIYRRIREREFFKLRGRTKIKDAVRIMRLCKKACSEWLEKETPGRSPKRAGWR